MKLRASHGPFEGVRGFFTPVSRIVAKAWSLAATKKADTAYQHRTRVPVISVGNLQVGGTGKTPLVLWLCQELAAKNKHVVVLSRGYGRRSKNTCFVAGSDAATEVGDEPLMLARKGLQVVVGPNRQHSAEFALQRAPDTELFVLDDGFLQRDLAVDYQVVLWDPTRKNSQDCMPYGVLRAPVESLLDADVLLVRRDLGDPASNETAQDQLFRSAKLRIPERIAVEYAGYTASCLQTSDGAKVEPEKARKARVVLAAGVGNPTRVAAGLSHLVDHCTLQSLVDHDPWDDQTVALLHNAMQLRAADALVITEKDWVKRDDWATLGFPVWVLMAEFGPANKALWGIEALVGSK